MDRQTKRIWSFLCKVCTLPGYTMCQICRFGLTIPRPGGGTTRNPKHAIIFMYTGYVNIQTTQSAECPTNKLTIGITMLGGSWAMDTQRGLAARNHGWQESIWIPNSTCKIQKVLGGCIDPNARVEGLEYVFGPMTTCFVCLIFMDDVRSTGWYCKPVIYHRTSNVVHKMVTPENKMALTLCDYYDFGKNQFNCVLLWKKQNPVLEGRALFRTDEAKP